MLMLAGTAGLGLLLGGGMFAGIYRFGVTRHELPVPGLRSRVRLVQLSDLHYGQWLQQGSVAEWVQAALAEQPDLLILNGDYIDSRTRSDTGPFYDALSPLSAPLGVYAVWGNHDHVMRSRTAELQSRFAAMGITVLTNEVAQVREDLQVAGVDDFRLGSPDLAGTIARLQPGVPGILVTHNPDQLIDVPAGSFSLALAGHTHGGQVRLPFIGAPHTQSAHGQRFVQGWVDAPVPAYVSRGLGVTALPIRLLCPPELVVIDLLPA